MANLIENERVKLFANALDRMSTACFTLGVVAPLAAALYNFGAVTLGSLAQSLWGAVWLFAAFVLHLAGRLVLGSLRE